MSTKSIQTIAEECRDALESNQLQVPPPEALGYAIAELMAMFVVYYPNKNLANYLVKARGDKRGRPKKST